MVSSENRASQDGHGRRRGLASECGDIREVGVLVHALSPTLLSALHSARSSLSSALGQALHWGLRPDGGEALVSSLLETGVGGQLTKW